MTHIQIRGKPRMRHVPVTGFTLVEVMITVVIIGILVGIAYPSYQNYTRQARRADAQSAVMQMANRLEKFFTYCNTYTVSLTGAWPASCPPAPAGSGLALANTLSPDQHYQITVQAGATTGTCSGGGANINCGYTIVANPGGSPGTVTSSGVSVTVPAATGVTGRQNNDGVFMLDSGGIKNWNRNNNGTIEASENTWK